MPSSEYTSAVGGGLKLKGSSGAGIDKKKLKKKRKEKTTITTNNTHSDTAAETRAFSQSGAIVADTDAATPADTDDGADGDEAAVTKVVLVDEDRTAVPGMDSAKGKREGDGELALTRADGKTDAERRYEERRRKRLDERLRREGVRTHKERVEQLNKYLSGLSEHHDMPRIGPG